MLVVTREGLQDREVVRLPDDCYGGAYLAMDDTSTSLRIESAASYMHAEVRFKSGRGRSGSVLSGLPGAVLRRDICSFDDLHLDLFCRLEYVRLV